MSFVEYQKKVDVSLGWMPQDVDTETLLSAFFSMKKSHHVAVIFDVATLTGDVVLSLLEGQGVISDVITAVTDGGAGAGDFGVAGDRSALYLAGQLFVVSGSTGNDGIYTVKAGGATYADGVTTIPVDEAVASAVVDGSITLMQAIAGKTITPGALTDERVLILEVSAEELDVANLYTSIAVRAVAGGAGGYIGCTIHRFPNRYSPL
ncbi:hypothetical protein ES703_19052 [subsurface metagenome]